MSDAINELKARAEALPEGDPTRVLYSQAIKSLESKDPEAATTASGDKDGDYGHDAPTLVEAVPAQFLGGATTFAEADEFRTGQEVDMGIWSQKNTFDNLHGNIWNDPALSVAEKAIATAAAAAELATRISAVPGEVAAEKSLSLVERVKEFILGRRDDSESETGRLSNEIMFFKDISGDLRWFAVHSNHWIDREGEIFPAEAHKEFEAWVDRTGHYPELRLWHTPGSRIGIADFVAYDEERGFMLSSGTFDKGMEDVAERLAGMDDIGCSHGYIFDEKEKQGGVFGQYRSYEVTILPGRRAANPWTAITVGQIAQEVKAGMKPEKQAFLVNALGPERAARIEAQLQLLGKELSDAGLSFKEVLTEEAPAPAAAPVAATTVATTVAPAAEVSPAAAVPSPAAAAPAPATTPETSETPQSAAPAAEAATTAAPAPAPAVAPTASPPAAAIAPEAAKAIAEGSQVSNALSEVVRVALEPVTAAITELREGLKELQGTDDERLAAKLRPRVSAPSTAARPTEASGNVLGADAAKAIEEASKEEGEGGDSHVAGYVEMALKGSQVGLQRGNGATPPAAPEAAPPAAPPPAPEAASPAAPA